ncbi:MAG TPA: glycogen synthase GlgA [Thermoanaerobaculia bacterium]|nr:glycogen synthase GlgA [Thermoanaerobaculia bacterium]
MAPLRRLRVATATSELAPLAKSGGLADVAGALAAHLHRQGHQVRAFLPLYASLQTAGRELRAVDSLQDVPLAMGRWPLRFSVYATTLPRSDLEVYLLHCPQLYGREGLYTGEWDEHLRFAFLGRAAIECCQRLRFSPDVFHCHDWHTALVPLYLKSLYGWDRLFQSTRTVLTLHNLGYQGEFSDQVLDDLGLGGERHLLFQDDLRAGRVSFLKTGLLYADGLTTVSRTYAREIQTPEQGMGLDPLLRQRRDSLVGIVNGVDYAEWSPENDRYIPFHYSASDLAGKSGDKMALHHALGLDGELDAPLIGIVSRLVWQKGFDLCLDTLPELVEHHGARLAVLGSGERRYEELFGWLARAFPGRAAYRRGYDDALAHLIEAGADLFLMPSRYEPCGLNQMYSLRYGTVPVVRATGGLADTVEPFDPASDRGTGFLFEHFTPAGLRWAARLALRTFRQDPAAWRRLMLRGMARDFSWERQGRIYEEVYWKVTGNL